MRLKGKVAIVIGGGTGIGNAIALALPDEGAAVALAARNLSRLQDVAKDIRPRGGKATAVQPDISDQEQVNQMAAQTVESLSTLTYWSTMLSEVHSTMLI